MDFNKKGLSDLKVFLKKNINQIKGESIGDIEPKSIPTKLFDFDNMTRGLRRGELIAFCGRPMMGKTSLAIQIAKNIAQVYNLPSFLFSFDISKEDIAYKIISMEAGIDAHHLRQGSITSKDLSVINQIIEEIEKLPIFIEDNKKITIDDIKIECRRIISESKIQSLGLIAIDSYHMINFPDKGNYQNKEKNIIIDLKLLAEELDVPILVTGPISRDVENRVNPRPKLSDILETDYLEKYSDIVAMIYRDEYYDPDTVDRGIAEIIVSKHKNGPLGTVKMLFEPQYGRFRNLAE